MFQTEIHTTTSSPDTDVFLLLIHFNTQLCVKTIFKTGRGKDIREVDVRKAYESITASHASGIKGFHVFTGCDLTGKCYGKSKSLCWKHLISCSEEELHAFSELGKSSDLPNENVVFGLASSKFILQKASYKY